MARANIIIDQGADFSTTITVRDTDGNIKDLSGHTGFGQIRKHYLSETAYDFEIVFQTPSSSGQVTLKMSRAETEKIEPGRYVYDVELTDQNDIRTRLVEGIVTVTPQVTRTPVVIVANTGNSNTVSSNTISSNSSSNTVSSNTSSNTASSNTESANT